jgi:parallel beta-helix repeat protein
MSHFQRFQRRSRAAHFGFAIVLAVAATMAVPLFALASPATAAAPAPTPITTCNYTITTPGRYALAKNLTCGSFLDSGIRVQASDVNLTLNGHTITGGGGYAIFGIFIDDSANAITGVRIAGPGTISGFDYGVGISGDGYSHGVRDSAVSGLTVTDNPGVGVYLEAANRPGLTDNVVSGNTVTGNGAGIVFDGFESVLPGTTFGNMFSGNTVTGNGFYGILLNGVVGSTVKGNTATGNTPDDLRDFAPCGSNVWKGDTFNTANPTCLH